VSGVGSATNVEHELRAICGEEHVGERESGGFEVSPASAEEVAACLRLANEQGLSVFPAGGGTEYPADCAGTDVILNTARLTQLEHYDHADLTVGVGAGMTVAQLSGMVGADRLLFASDPPRLERCTVGGLLATASHGPLRHGYGALRDFCIGIRFVTGDGRRAKGGGRVVKNVAGYDLMKLLIGSYGTLAVTTSASFKLFPAPRQTRTFLVEFSSPDEALQFRDRVMRSPLSPMCLELVSPRARKLMWPGMMDEAWVVCVRAAGSDPVLARYRRQLGWAITRELAGDDEKTMWRAIENFPSPPDKDNESGGRERLRQRIQIIVPPRDAIRVVDTLNDIDKHGEISVAFIGRVGVGHVLAVARDADCKAQSPIDVVVAALRDKLGADINVKVDSAANPWPISPQHLASMRAVKQALDPKNILRGRATF
jgi:glycolate oxidase FAD binding subunit